METADHLLKSWLIVDFKKITLVDLRGHKFVDVNTFEKLSFVYVTGVIGGEDIFFTKIFLSQFQWMS